MSFSYRQTGKRSYTYPSQDKRDSPIISTISGPNNVPRSSRGPINRAFLMKRTDVRNCSRVKKIVQNLRNFRNESWAQIEIDCNFAHQPHTRDPRLSQHNGGLIEGPPINASVPHWRDVGGF